MPKGKYSELECFVMGLVWQLGSASAYDVRRAMADSPSSQWSASTGAIYPLMRRLQRCGLLSGKQEKKGQRARRIYIVTAAGKRVLRHWIGPPFAPEAVSVSHDPLRSRARFLAVLPPAEREAWVQAAINAVDQVAQRVQAWDKKYGSRDEFQFLVSRNGELETQARRQWLREFADRLHRDKFGA